MKKTIIFSMLLILSAMSFSQDYLKKSKSQKTAAWLLLGGGIALDVIAAAWAGSDFSSSGPDVLFVVGSASIVGSIPLFIAAARNKRKAKAATGFLKFEKTPVIQQSGFALRSFPALGVKMHMR